MSARPCAGCGLTGCQCAHGAVERREQRIAELEADTRQLRDILAQERQRFVSEAVPARREQREWEYMRGERDGLRTRLGTALAEVARLEALILSWDDDEDRYGDPVRALRCEASCIRGRKP